VRLAAQVLFSYMCLPPSYILWHRILVFTFISLVSRRVVKSNLLLSITQVLVTVSLAVFDGEPPQDGSIMWYVKHLQHIRNAVY
jgi:hypothetical protein